MSMLMATYPFARLDPVAGSNLAKGWRVQTLDVACRGKRRVLYIVMIDRVCQ